MVLTPPVSACQWETKPKYLCSSLVSPPLCLIPPVSVYITFVCDPAFPLPTHRSRQTRVKSQIGRTGDFLLLLIFELSPESAPSV